MICDALDMWLPSIPRLGRHPEGRSADRR